MILRAVFFERNPTNFLPFWPVFRNDSIDWGRDPVVVVVRLQIADFSLFFHSDSSAAEVQIQSSGEPMRAPSKRDSARPAGVKDGNTAWCFPIPTKSLPHCLRMQDKGSVTFSWGVLAFLNLNCWYCWLFSLSNRVEIRSCKWDIFFPHKCDPSPQL